MERLKHLENLVLLQQEQKSAWNEKDTAFSVANLLEGEVQELIEAIEMAEIGAGAYEVASELGDCMFLLIKIANLAGIDLLSALEMKAIRNSKKYDHHINNNGYSDEKAQRLSKEIWNEMDGERMFSIAYMKLADEL
jgi:NTP pyrophosphatase (non-canonical NTP hydrolase)